MQPLIKYTGSKRHFAKEISLLYPKYSKALVPFCGGGSFLPQLQGNILASDLCSPLIRAFNLLKSSPEELLNSYTSVQEEYIKDRDVYYKIRDQFNSNKDRGDLFFILTRLCFNGLIRWNSEGDFNTSCHFSRDGIKPEKLAKVIESWSSVLNRTDFICEDYRDTFDRARPNNFVVCDPPYIATKGQYQSVSFDFLAFWDALEELNSKGINWLVCLDHNLDLNLVPDIYKNIHKTRELNSSFNRLKLKNVNNGNTLLTNY